jgi:hypothetical protein
MSAICAGPDLLRAAPVAPPWRLNQNRSLRAYLSARPSESVLDGFTLSGCVDSVRRRTKLSDGLYGNARWIVGRLKNRRD